MTSTATMTKRVSTTERAQQTPPWRKAVTSDIGARTASYLGFLLLWLVAAAAFTRVPGPIEVVERLVEEFARGEVFGNFASTLYRFGFGVLLAEEIFHAYRATGNLGPAVMDVWSHRDRNVILAKVICVALTFGAYHLYMGIDRHLGEGTLRRIVTSRPGEPTAPKKERDNGHSREAQHSGGLG